MAEKSDPLLVLSPEDFVINGNSPEICAAVPFKPDHNVRWLERSTTYHLPNVSFSYEATYTNVTPNGAINFGFSVQWQRLPYSLRFTNRYMLYCVVKSVHPDFSNVISKGDIVLKMNEECLFYQYGDAIPSDEVLINKFEQRKNPLAIVRFLRIASNSPNAMISPSEIVSFSQDKSTAAKFTLKLNKETPPKLVLENTAIEVNTPAAVRRMVQTSNPVKPSWMSVPAFKEGPVDARAALSRVIQYSQSTNVTQATLSNIVGTYVSNVILPTMSVQNTQPIDHSKCEVYREKTKYVAVYADESVEENTVKTSVAEDESLSLSVAASLHMKKENLIQQRRMNRKRPVSLLYNIGKYESEEEAKRNIQRAKMTSETYEMFDPYYFIKELTKKASPAFASSSNSNVQGPTILTLNMSSVASAAAIGKN